MYLAFEFAIKDRNVCENLDLLISLHPLNAQLILIIRATHLNDVFVLGTLSDYQGVRLAARQLLALDVFDWCQAKDTLTISNAKLALRSIACHIECLIFAQ